MRLERFMLRIKDLLVNWKCNDQYQQNIALKRTVRAVVALKGKTLCQIGTKGLTPLRIVSTSYLEKDHVKDLNLDLFGSWIS